MNSFDEFKAPYEAILKSKNIDIKDYNLQDVVADVADDVGDKDVNMSILIIAAWKSFRSIYYKQKTKELTMEDCYDIFLDSIHYLIDRQPWTKPGHKLYGDEDAFLKGVNTCIKSLRVNFIEAQHKQKRRVNYKAASLDYLDDAFAEGLVDDDADRLDTDLEEIPLEQALTLIIKNCFKAAQYEDAVMLHALLYGDVYTSNGNGDVVLNRRSLRKELRTYFYTEAFAKEFAETYGLTDREQVRYAFKILEDGIKDLKAPAFDCSINSTFKRLRLNPDLKQFLKD